MGWTYRDAGVDIEEAARLKGRLKEMAGTTFGPEVLSELGGFGGLFAVPRGFREPVLVASTDGVGTKLKIAVLAGRHDTVGQDLVNHCVNDLLVQGARPLFFLDYFATGRLVPEVVEKVVEGLAAACLEAGCALLGGETAEMPGMYREGEYDLAGTMVGIVEREAILPRPDVAPGDLVLGLAANGLHTNGYSLVRRLCLEELGMGLAEYVPEFGRSLGEELLRIHRNYEPLLRPVLAEGLVKALVHLTGGGYQGNIPRVLPAGLGVRIDPRGWPIQPIFSFLARHGRIAREEMFRTFNMGLGLLLIAAPEAEERIRNLLGAAGEEVYRAGLVIEGEGVEILGE
ncbi:MAG: phosphoribosylformylglycinamidine cyclo-ligase [Firmicutes bacterium]|nr:phosphoribosylformylglycinamidine cyclo-ligase [Bacillota bacterium]